MKTEAYAVEIIWEMFEFSEDGFEVPDAAEWEDVIKVPTWSG